MFCFNCGKKIKDGVDFCPYCGNAVKQKKKAADTSESMSELFHTGMEEKKSVGKRKIRWVILGAVSICIVICGGILFSKVIPEHREKKQIEQEKQECADAIKQAFDTIKTETDELSVHIFASANFQTEYDGVGMKDNYSDEAIVDFKNGQAHFSEAESYNELLKKNFDGTGHSDTENYEIYIDKNGQAFRSLNSSEFEECTADAFEMDDCFWFWDDIKKNLASDSFTVSPEDEDSLLLNGILEGSTKICEAYMNFMNLLGDEPEYYTIDKIPYTIYISKSEQKILEIEFDISDIAQKVWYGTNLQGLDVNSASGSFKIRYRSFENIDDFTVPEYEDDSTAEDVLGMPEWQQAYIEYFSQSDNCDFKTFDLVDINHDGVPEVCTDTSNSAGQGLIYINQQNEVKKIANTNIAKYGDKCVYFYNTRVGLGTDTIYKYNEQTGEYSEVFDGEYNYETYSGYTVDGLSCTKEDYEKKIEKCKKDCTWKDIDTTKYAVEDFREVISDYNGTGVQTGGETNSSTVTWQQAYIDYLTSEEEIIPCIIAYIDDDDIPEIFQDFSGDYGTCRILSYHDGEVKVSEVLSSFSVQYKNSVIYAFGRGMVSFYNIIYDFENGVAVEKIVGEQVRNPDNGGVVRWIWDGKEVSKKKYDRLWEEALGMEDLQTYEGGVSEDEVISYLMSMQEHGVASSDVSADTDEDGIPDNTGDVYYPVGDSRKFVNNDEFLSVIPEDRLELFNNSVPDDMLSVYQDLRFVSYDKDTGTIYALSEKYYFIFEPSEGGYSVSSTSKESADWWTFDIK